MNKDFKKRCMSDTLFGIVIQQTWADIFRMETFIRSAGLGCVLEIGTGCGAFSIFFGLHNSTITVDIDKNRSEGRAALLMGIVGVRRMIGDAWISHEYFHAFARDAAQGKPLFIFCDGGDKQKEFDLYSRYLLVGDYIGAHDKNIEFFDDKALGSIKEHNLVEVPCDEETLISLYRKEK